MISKCIKHNCADNAALLMWHSPLRQRCVPLQRSEQQLKKLALHCCKWRRCDAQRGQRDALYVWRLQARVCCGSRRKAQGRNCQRSFGAGLGARVRNTLYVAAALHQCLCFCNKAHVASIAGPLCLVRPYLHKQCVPSEQQSEPNHGLRGQDTKNKRCRPH